MKDRFKLRVYDKVVKRYLTDDDVYEITDGILDNLYDLLNDENRRFILGKHDLIFELCTGLKDKNGKLIYEGDIVKWDNELYSPEVVSWEYNPCTLSVGLGAVDENTEIIGNIHENPELLED